MNYNNINNTLVSNLQVVFENLPNIITQITRQRNISPYEALQYFYDMLFKRVSNIINLTDDQIKNEISRIESLENKLKLISSTFDKSSKQNSDDLRKLNDAYSKSTREVLDHYATINQLKNDLDSKNKTVQELQEINKKLTAEIKQMNSKVVNKTMIQKKLEEAKETMAKEHKDLEKLQKANSANVRKLNTLIRTLYPEYNKKVYPDTLIESYVKKIDALMQTVQSYNIERGQFDLQINTLKEELDRISKNQITENDTSYNSITETIDSIINGAANESNERETNEIFDKCIQDLSTKTVSQEAYDKLKSRLSLLNQRYTQLLYGSSSKATESRIQAETMQRKIEFVKKYIDYLMNNVRLDQTNCNLDLTKFLTYFNSAINSESELPTDINFDEFCLRPEQTQQNLTITEVTAATDTVAANTSNYDDGDVVIANNNVNNNEQPQLMPPPVPTTEISINRSIANINTNNNENLTVRNERTTIKRSNAEPPTNNTPMKTLKLPIYEDISSDYSQASLKSKPEIIEDIRLPPLEIRPQDQIEQQQTENLIVLNASNLDDVSRECDDDDDSLPVQTPQPIDEANAMPTYDGVLGFSVNSNDFMINKIVPENESTNSTIATLNTPQNSNM